MATESTPSTNTIPLQRCSSLYINTNTPKGRGVFTSSIIPSGTIIDICPVLLLDPKENVNHIEKTSLYHYTYVWPRRDSDGNVYDKAQAVIFGLGSMFNHSTRDQNVGWKRDLDRQVVVYRALRDIQAGEELCISYGDRLTFEDADAPADPDANEDEEEVLGRIQLET